MPLNKETETMERASSKVRTKVAVSISYDDNHYTTTVLDLSFIYWCEF